MPLDLDALVWRLARLSVPKARLCTRQQPGFHDAGLVGSMWNYIVCNGILRCCYIYIYLKVHAKACISQDTCVYIICMLSVLRVLFLFLSLSPSLSVSLSLAL